MGALLAKRTPFWSQVHQPRGAERPDNKVGGGGPNCVPILRPKWSCFQVSLCILLTVKARPGTPRGGPQRQASSLRNTQSKREVLSWAYTMLWPTPKSTESGALLCPAGQRHPECTENHCWSHRGNSRNPSPGTDCPIWKHSSGQMPPPHPLQPPCKPSWHPHLPRPLCRLHCLLGRMGGCIHISQPA